MRSAVRVLAVIAAAGAFGAADQYLGGRYTPFLTAVSGMSAPWLLLPFAAGALQASRARAAVLGLVATWAAVTAYVLMIISPVEGAQFGLRAIETTGASQWLWFLGGLVSGPLYGLLGYHCRTRRSWPLALVATIPVVLEPATRWATGHLGVLGTALYPPASAAEIIVGLALTAAVAVGIARSRASQPPAGLS